MSVLEKAVAELANALDHLEGKLDSGLTNHSVSAEEAEITLRHAESARTYAEVASEELASTIAELRSILNADKTTPGIK